MSRSIKKSSMEQRTSFLHCFAFWKSFHKYICIKRSRFTKLCVHFGNILKRIWAVNLILKTWRHQTVIISCALVSQENMKRFCKPVRSWGFPLTAYTHRPFCPFSVTSSYNTNPCALCQACCGGGMTVSGSSRTCPSSSVRKLPTTWFCGAWSYSKKG